MMTGVTSRRVELPEAGLDDLLEKLTATHSLMLERFGQIWLDAPEPYDPIFYAAKATSLAAAIDNAADLDEKRVALLDSEAARHDQIGKLALHIAAYEAAHGDPGHVRAMRELGRDHIELASRLQQTLDDELVMRMAAGTDEKLPQGEPETVTLQAIQRDPWNAVNLFPPDDNDLVLWTTIEETASGLVEQKTAELDEIAATPGGLKSDAYAKAEAAGFEAEQRRLLAEEVLEQARQEHPAELLTVEAIERDPWNALVLLLPDDAPRPLLIEAGRAVARIYADHEAYERRAAGSASLQVQLINRADQLASRLGLPTGYDITHGRGEFGAGLLSRVSDQTRAEAKAAWTHQPLSQQRDYDL